MDEQVLRAMARWPDVPAVYGWLRLDRRGRWLLVDRGRPGFDEARDGAGSTITSPPIIDFIGRNYTSDENGRWYWQNGPQRVYVDLDSAPLVLRVLEGAPAQSPSPSLPASQSPPQWPPPPTANTQRDLPTPADAIAAQRFVTHTGFRVQRIDAGWIGPAGEILLRTDLGPAVVHDLDAPALPLDEAGDDIVLRLASGTLTLPPTDSPATTLGYDPRPRA